MEKHRNPLINIRFEYIPVEEECIPIACISGAANMPNCESGPNPPSIPSANRLPWNRKKLTARGLLRLVETHQMAAKARRRLPSSPADDALVRPALVSVG